MQLNCLAALFLKSTVLPPALSSWAPKPAEECKEGAQSLLFTSRGRLPVRSKAATAGTQALEDLKGVDRAVYLHRSDACAMGGQTASDGYVADGAAGFNAQCNRGKL